MVLLLLPCVSQTPCLKRCDCAGHFCWKGLCLHLEHPRHGAQQLCLLPQADGVPAEHPACTQTLGTLRHSTEPACCCKACFPNMLHHKKCSTPWLGTFDNKTLPFISHSDTKTSSKILCFYKGLCMYLPSVTTIFFL